MRARPMGTLGATPAPLGPELIASLFAAPDVWGWVVRG